MYHWVAIDITVSGDHVVVPAQVDAHIKVMGVCFTTTGAVKVAWKSGTTVLIPPMNFTPGMPCWVPRTYNSFVKTAVNEPLVLNTSSNADLAGYLEYGLEYHN